MGTSRSPAHLASKLIRAGGAVDGAARDGVFRSALMVKNSVLVQMQAAGVRGGRLRGVGKKGAKIGVRFDVKGTKNPTALVRATGPFHLIENPTKAHLITPKARGKKQALRIGSNVRGAVQHPGTKGKSPWAKGINLALPKVRQTMVSEQAKSLARYFR